MTIPPREFVSCRLKWLKCRVAISSPAKRLASGAYLDYTCSLPGHTHPVDNGTEVNHEHSGKTI